LRTSAICKKCIERDTLFCRYFGDLNLWRYDDAVYKIVVLSLIL